MKRFLILFFAVLLLFPLSAFSQDNLSKRIGSIKNSLDADTESGFVFLYNYETDLPLYPLSKDFKSFEMRAKKDANSNKLTLYIQCYYDVVTNTWIRVYPEEMDSFVSSMNTVFGKFIEWSNVAKDNHIKDFKKDIPLSCTLVNFGPGKYDDYYFEDKPFACEFSVDSMGNSELRIFAEPNDDGHGAYLFFKSGDKLRDFVSKIQPKSVKAEYDKKEQMLLELKNAENSQDALFK